MNFGIFKNFIGPYFQTPIPIFLTNNCGGVYLDFQPITTFITVHIQF